MGINALDAIVAAGALNDPEIGVNCEHLEMDARDPEAPPADLATGQCLQVPAKRAAKHRHGFRN